MDTPKIPTLKDAQKPQVKIKGLGAGLTLFDRLKQFKKKDLAFILAGLGTLFMAPLAEHFMMAPENGDATMSPGWGGGKGGANFFGGGSSPYEPGANGLASGNSIGGGGDIITPLNVRDPSSLVMGPGSSQQPPAGSVTPPTAPPTAPSRSDSDLKDALSGAASRAASQAVKRAPLPVPKVALGGSGLRGLGVAGGGSSASAGMAAPGAAAGSVGGGGGNGLNLVRTSPNFKGVAGPRGSGNPQGLDNIKKAGANAGDAFSRSGSALANLNGAASEQIPTGGTGFSGAGQGGVGQNDKNPGGSGPGGSKNVGESLAFIAAKERMMKDLEIEFEKRKLNDMGLVFGGIRNDMLKSIATKGIAEPMGAWLGGIVSKGANGANSTRGWYCGAEQRFYPKGTYCVDSNNYLGTPGQGGACALVDPRNPLKCSGESDGPSDKDKTAPSTREDALNVLRVGVGDVCKRIDDDLGKGKSEYDEYLRKDLKLAAQRAESARNLLIGGGTPCGSANNSDPVANPTAAKLLNDALALVYVKAAPVAEGAEAPPAKDAMGMITQAADKTDVNLAKGPVKALTDAFDLIKKADARIGDAEKALGESANAPEKKTNVAAFGEVAAKHNQVTSAHTSAKQLILRFRRSSENLSKVIGSMKPIVAGEPARGGLPDQLTLNDAVNCLGQKVSGAEQSCNAIPAADFANEVVDLVAKQNTTRKAMKEVETALARGEKQENGKTGKAEAEEKFKAAKPGWIESQSALKKVVTDLEASATTVDIPSAGN